MENSSDTFNVARIASREAVTLTGVDPVLLKNVIDRGHYTAAPPAGKGHVRTFAADDLVALTIFNQLVSFKIIPAVAARIASEIRTTMRERPEIETIWLVKDTDRQGRPLPMLIDWQPDDPADVLFTFRVAVYRRQAAADIAGILASKGAN